MLQIRRIIKRAFYYIHISRNLHVYTCKLQNIETEEKWKVFIKNFYSFTNQSIIDEYLILQDL